MASTDNYWSRYSRRVSRRSFLAAGLSAGVGIAAAACSGSEAPKAAVTAVPSPAGTPFPTPTPGLTGLQHTLAVINERFPNPPPKPSTAPKYGGQLRVPGPNYASLDPTVTGASMVQGAVYNKLVHQKLGRFHPELFYTPQMYGALAEKWEQPDVTTYIFSLRKGVKFHNLPPVNGRELDSTDVKVSWDTYRAGGIAAHAVGDVEQTEAPDRYTFKINLKEPIGTFIEKTAAGGPALWILPRELWDVPGGPREVAIGTGSFVLKEYSRDKGWLAERNKDFFLTNDEGRQLPFLDSYKGITMTDMATKMAAFRSKQIDMIEPYSLRQVDEILRTNPETFVLQIPPRAGWFQSTLLYRLDNAPFNDVRVRRAISLALDREDLKKTVYDGTAELNAPFSWEFAGFTDWPPKVEWLGQWWKYDPAQARRLLGEAGYPNGFKSKMSFAPSAITPNEDIALHIKEDLKKIGIELEVQQMESAAFTQLRSEYSWEGVILSSKGGVGCDWDSWVYWAYRSGSPQNYDRVNDPELDKMLIEARRAQNKTEQVALSRKVWDRLIDQVYDGRNLSMHHHTLTHPYVEDYSDFTYAWSQYYGADQIMNTFLRDDAPGRKV